MRYPSSFILKASRASDIQYVFLTFCPGNKKENNRTLSYSRSNIILLSLCQQCLLCLHSVLLWQLLSYFLSTFIIQRIVAWMSMDLDANASTCRSKELLSPLLTVYHVVKQQQPIPRCSL